MFYYYATFNDKGERTSTIARGIHFKTDEELQKYLDEGYIGISDDDYKAYLNNMVRDEKTGRPVEPPPYIPTKTDLANNLYRDYSRAVKMLNEEILNAMADGSDDIVQELREEKVELFAAYQDELKEVMK